MKAQDRARRWTAFGAAFLTLALLGAAARAAEPIKIGFTIELSGGLVNRGKSVLPAMEMWQEEVNAKGGFFGAPYACARMQLLVAASEATKSLGQKTLADYPHRAKVSTVLGDTDFGPDGEPPEPRQLFLQHQGIVATGSISSSCRAGRSSSSRRSSNRAGSNIPMPASGDDYRT